MSNKNQLGPGSRAALSVPPLRRGSCGPLEIEPLGCSFLLLVEDVLLGFLEVFVRDFHPAFPQGHEPSFCADGLSVQQQLHSNKPSVLVSNKVYMLLIKSL